MGCAQTSPTISPYNHIPIDRLYRNPTVQQPLPPIAIPVPPYVKGVLKKPYPYGREGPEPLSMLRTKPLLMNRTVNFDEKVLVKPRTPSPDKVWYEKASSTMPMRKHPCDDNDDYDYDYNDEENGSHSPDEEQIDNEQNNLTYPTKSMKRNGNSKSSTLNRIKVRRKLPDLGPPQLIHAPSYQLPIQSSTTPTYSQSSSQISAVPVHHLSTQHLNTSLFRTSTVTPYQPPLQYPTVPTTQASTTFSHPSAITLPSGVPIISQNPPVPSSVQQPIVASLQMPTTVSYPSLSTTYSAIPLVANTTNQTPSQTISQIN
ncbi:hypothetical protein I4U23_006277 [Adineta vaga]|nr:hypothetical protein I4U23_006277 [Adineta vaga]